MDIEEDPTIFNRTQPKQFPAKILKETPEQKHWKKYKQLFQTTYNDSVKSVLSQNCKQLFALTHGNVVEIYNPNKQKNITIQKLFNDEITTALIRQDGRLVATGENSGRVQIIDIKKRQPLRRFSFHTKSVYAVQFIDNQIITGSDDMKIKLIDFQTEEVIRSYNNLHEDFIRSIQTLPNTTKTILSSGYDHKINIFDLNQETSGMVFNHGCPVESISCLNNGFGFVSVGGHQTKLWDIRTNKILYEITNNQKTITNCRVVGDRILTSSLDQHLKIFDIEGLKVTHQQKFNSPILGFDISQDKNFYGIGLSDGTFLLKNLKQTDENIEYEDEKEHLPNFMNNVDINSNRARNFKFFNRGRHVKQENYDVKIVEKKKKILQHDQFLKKFQYKKGLMSVLRTNQTDLIISYLEEIIQRNALNIALSKLEQVELKIVLTFIARKIKNSNCNDILLECLFIIQENYNTQENQQLFLEIENILNDEIKLQINMLEVQGALETIINCNTLL